MGGTGMSGSTKKGQRGITRREMLVGAGAISAVTLGSVALSSAAEEALSWDHETDILVVGSGAAACAAAVTADQNGDRALVVEKAPITGGTAAKSAGVLWIPNNFALKEKGIEDARDDCLRYMVRFSYPERYDPADAVLGIRETELNQLQAFYDNASLAIDSLRAHGDLRIGEWRMFALDRPATDYLDHVPENKVPTGRALGPLSADGTMGLGAELMAQFSAALERRGVPVLTGHRAARAILNAAGRVIGLECEAAGKTVNVRAHKAVIFGTGGYAHNTDFVATYQSVGIDGSCAMPWSTGDFIGIAGAVGARMGDLSTAWRTQIVLEEALQARTLGSGVFFPPGDSMLQVNRHGVRVVNEHRNYNDRTEAHGYYDASAAEFPNRLLFMIYDQRSAEAFAGAYPFPETPTGGKHVLAADTLDALGARIESRLEEISGRTGGLRLAPAFTDNLKNAITHFNGYAGTGNDTEFQRGKAAYDNEWHLVFSPMRADTDWPRNEGPTVTMHPFRDEGPFYAIILAAGALDTSGGPDIDASSRVLNTANAPIPGLYGAGNCIASPSGEAYYGAGHTLGMAITFGYIAANAAHLEPAGDA
jgi:succinate dehydrogenase/fumarate reductase flavoprotein subunit